jgi:hypothetical protein
MGLFLGAVVVTTGIDLVMPLGTGLRLVALVLVVGPAAWAFFAGVVRPLVRRLSAGHVARRIENELPGIHNRLVSCIDLETSGRKGSASPVFYRRLLTEALERIRGFRPAKVLDLLSLRRASIFAGVSACAFILAFCLFSDRLPTALARIFLPFADIPPASGVKYTVQPGHADILRDEEIGFEAQVVQGEPKELRLELYGASGATHTYDLKPDRHDGSVWKTTVDGASLGAGFENGFCYRILGGGTWSKQYAIHLVERPVLASVQTAVFYPKYMDIPEPHPTPPQAIEVTGPEGGKVEVVVNAQGQVATGEIQILQPAMRAIPRQDQVEHVWFEDKLPFGAAAEGTWKWETRDRRLIHTEPVAIGTHGHWFQGDPVGQSVGTGDILFAYVYVVPGQEPESIMLQWHDGDTWDHGAYWGADRIREGKANSPARRRQDDLPGGGQWVRLEVPAASVGLEGKRIRGMAFKLHGGQCWWSRTGTVQVEEPSVAILKTFAMSQTEDGHWAGRFPLTGSGLFRAELRNEQGHANKPMKEMKYVALPDKAPQVILDRQSTETVLSQPAALPLTITAFDDYGLAEITLRLRDSEEGEYRSRTLYRFARPQRSHSLVAALQEAAQLPMGGQLRYLIEAKDRKGQIGRTPEYVVRIAADPNAADQKLNAFDRSQDPFRERLIQLIGQQQKIQGSMEKLNRDYATLTEKSQNQAKPDGKTDPGQVKPQDKNPNDKLDPETAKKLQELQKELAKLAQQEQQNTQTAQQLSNDLATAAEQASQLEMLPRAIADQMQATQQAFQHRGVEAMRDLGQQMSRGADPKAGMPNLQGMQRQGERLQKELEGIKARMDALAQARKGIRDDLREALRQLQQEMLAQRGNLSARELEELKDFLARMREQMQRLQERQEELLKNTQDGADLAKIKGQQEDLDKQLEKMLADARNLLDSKRRNRQRNFPDAPYTPEGEETKVPPKEEDTDEALPGKKDKTGKSDPRADKKATEDEDKEPLDMPALGGPKQKVDPRFARKQRPVKRTPPDGKNDRADLEERQAQHLENLDAARKSLASDQQTLEQMMRQLEQALKASASKQGQPQQGNEAQDELARMLQSPAMQEAMAMAARMRQGPQSQSKGKGQQSGQASTSASGQTGNLRGTMRPGSSLSEADLAKFDPETRAVILKLPPSRLRDELIQGMNEQGPEAYRAFIQDYFKRLTETKNPGK